MDDELDTLQAAAVERHLAGCDNCNAALTVQRALRDTLRSKAPYHRASGELRARIISATAGPAPVTPSVSYRRHEWLRWATPLAAGLVLTIALNFGLETHRRDRHVAEEILDAHVRSLMVDHLEDVPSTDQHTVKPWFADKLPFSPPVRDLAGEGFPLVGGRLDYLEHHPAAALVYKHRLHVINLFIWPAQAPLAAAMSKQTHSGFNLIRWHSGGMEFAAVSDLNDDELEEFARLIRQGSA
jgi:anti-sigma factor RsiW